MKVSLVRPRYVSVWECLALGYIAGHLRRHFKGELELRYFDGFFDDDDTIIKGSKDCNIVGFSCTSPQMKHALALARCLKRENPGIVTVFGGHHPSALPEQTLRNQEVDNVVSGEGETGMLRILGERRGKRIVYCPPIKNLDSIPFPDRRLIRQERTIALTEKNNGERIASVLSSRGCPHNCIFCTGDHDVFGFGVRHRSPSNVLDEIEELVSDWRIDLLKFADAEVNNSIRWLESFCSEKMARRIEIPWGANIHAGSMSKPLLQWMKDSNCREIWVGVESGSPRTLSEFRKGITVDQVIRVFNWAKEFGLRRRAYFMVGAPSETLEDFELTMKLAERLDADDYGMTILCPYPGTALYDHDLYGDVDWSVMDEYSNPVYRTANFSNEELHRLQKHFTERFKDRLAWRLRQKDYRF